MNPLTYFLVKLSFWDQLKREVDEVLRDFSDIFEMLKDVTYGNLEKLVGPDIALMLVIGVGAILVMIVCLKVINR